MGSRILADTLLVLHLSFILFAICGSFLAPFGVDPPSGSCLGDSDYPAGWHMSAYRVGK